MQATARFGPRSRRDIPPRGLAIGTPAEERLRFPRPWLGHTSVANLSRYTPTCDTSTSDVLRYRARTRQPLSRDGQSHQTELQHGTPFPNIGRCNRSNSVSDRLPPSPSRVPVVAARQVSWIGRQEQNSLSRWNLGSAGAQGAPAPPTTSSTMMEQRSALMRNIPPYYSLEARSASQDLATTPVTDMGTIQTHMADNENTQARRPSSRGTTPPQTAMMQTPLRGSSSSGSMSSYNFYPPPCKPLPPLPQKAKRVGRISSQSQDSFDTSSNSTDRFSKSSAATSNLDTAPSLSLTLESSDAAGQRPNTKAHTSRSSVKKFSMLQLSLGRILVSHDKRNDNGVYYLHTSPRSAILASKHGNDIIKIWTIDDGEVQAVIKISSYTEAHSRSREYLIRSHAILSEASGLIAIATKFGRAIEIWNWVKKKCLQTIHNADRWTGGRNEVYGEGCSPLAVYRADANSIDLYMATLGNKAFTKTRSINLTQANLPFVPQYPELVLSGTSPLLVVAAGPRPPRLGHPPPDKETLLIAWDTNDDGFAPHKPFRVARPWQHEEIKTAIPCELTTYGSVVVSIWIPATFQVVAVPPSRGGAGYNLVPVPVPSRYVLVWDLSANSTRTFAIPNCTSCISPDCRYVAYCHASGAGIGARGCLCVLDVVDGREVWCWPDKDALAVDSGPRLGFEQFDDLAQVTELSFLADGRSLIVGEKSGRMCVYNIRE
ncbi:Uncharacterized protein TPAR_04873 [Tolypocladium paradoxum]|uniref:Uncharacterized protein n=1 Tax=Tolypocladium paradoxum TaxID=94208 RepID=A0A2S4KXL1_9HYPO|nr:Uncharacterized protein TPAR_04873 [Tolypocladium paradoxum]